MGTDQTKLNPTDLAAAAAKAAATAPASAPTPVAMPAAVGTSPLDVAAAEVAASIQALVSDLDAADVTAASKQAEALAKAPPILVEQDHDNGAAVTAAGGGATAIQSPTPTVVAPKPGTVWNV
jgi:hypothetical protein